MFAELYSTSHLRTSGHLDVPHADPVLVQRAIGDLCSGLVDQRRVVLLRRICSADFCRSRPSPSNTGVGHSVRSGSDRAGRVVLLLARAFDRIFPKLVLAPRRHQRRPVALVLLLFALFAVARIPCWRAGGKILPSARLRRSGAGRRVVYHGRCTGMVCHSDY
jgi:hypothetical protein